MAEHKVSGGTMLLFIDPNGGTTYDTVVCLKSVGVSDSINQIDTSSWCGPGKLPGLLNISYSFDGYHVQDVDSGNISGTDLRMLLRNKTRIGWKLSPLNPVAGDEIQFGTGFLSYLSSSYSFNSTGTFNFTLQCHGIPTLIIESGYTGTFTFINDTAGTTPYNFQLYSASPFTLVITTFSEFEITAVPDLTYGYIASFNGYAGYGSFDVNFNVNDPTQINGINLSYGNSGTTCYRCTDLNIGNLNNLLYVFINYNKLITSNVNQILLNTINSGINNGAMSITTQYPAVTPNSSYLSTLTSNGWTIF